LIRLKSIEERAQSKVYPPTQEKSVGYKVNTFEELYVLAEEIRNNNKKTDGTEVLRTSTGIALPDNGDTSGNADGRGYNRQSRQDDSDGGNRGARKNGRENSSGRNSSDAVSKGTQIVGASRSRVSQPGIPGLFDTEEPSTQQQPETRTNSRSSEGRGLDSDRGRGSESNVGEVGRVQFGRVQNVGASSSGVGVTQQPKETPKSGIKQAPVQTVKPKVEEKRELDTEKLSYRPHNTAFCLQSVALILTRPTQ